MPSFAELYCAQHECAAEQFTGRAFRAALYPHARVCSGLIEALDRNFFAADLRFVGSVAAVRDMKQIRVEVREYFLDSSNSGWLRRKLNLRISGQRMTAFASRYLPENSAPPAAGRGSAQPESRRV